MSQSPDPQARITRARIAVLRALKATHGRTVRRIAFSCLCDATGKASIPPGATIKAGDIIRVTMKGHYA